MSAWTKLRAAVLSIAGAALLMLCGCEEQKYPSGRDTKDSFGNGRFQVVRGPSRFSMCDCERRVTVVDNVKNWKARAGYVFLVDANGKCWKVDYRSGAVTSFEKPDAAEAADRKIFEKLLK
jgi:hypothetical protein